MLFTSPVAIFSTLSLYRRDQFISFSTIGVRRISNTRLTSSPSTMSRTPTFFRLSTGTKISRSSDESTESFRYSRVTPLTVRCKISSTLAAP